MAGMQLSEYLKGKELDPLTDKIIGKKVFKHGHCMEKYSGNLGLERPTN